MEAFRTIMFGEREEQFIDVLLTFWKFREFVHYV